jgi:hypothetical protein
MCICIIGALKYVVLFIYKIMFVIVLSYLAVVQEGPNM